MVRTSGEAGCHPGNGATGGGGSGQLQHLEGFTRKFSTSANLFRVQGKVDMRNKNALRATLFTQQTLVLLHV